MNSHRATALAVGLVVGAVAIVLAWWITRPTTAGTSAPRVETELSSTETFESGTTLAPARNGSAATSADDALKTAESYNFDKFDSVREEYGLFTDTRSGTVNGDDGSVTPYFVDRPAWVVTFTNDCPPVLGPIPQQTAKDAQCTSDYHVVVDADSGEFLMSFTSS